MTFLANTGFLFASLPFPERLRAAAESGFDGVEFHDEVQRHDAAEIADVLAQTGLRMGGLNIRMGATAGCAAIAGQEDAFAADMRAAHAAAEAVGARAIHVLAGHGDTRRDTYLANLRRALDLTDRQILIEPISRAAMPDYHLRTLDEALEVQAALGNPRLAILFDWYHITAEIGHSGACVALARHRTQIGHVQVASFPQRAEPDAGLIRDSRAQGFAMIGFEYRPTMPEGAALAGIRARLAATND